MFSVSNMSSMKVGSGTTITSKITTTPEASSTSLLIKRKLVGAKAGWFDELGNG